MTYRSKQADYIYKYSKMYRAGHRATMPDLVARRMIQGLQAIGYSYPDIAEETGLTRSQICKIVKGQEGRTRIRIATFKKIEACYQKWQWQPKEGGRANLTRSWALKKHYAPPGAWDDIYDPMEEPKGYVVRGQNECFRGHKQTEGTVYVCPSTGRAECRICRRLIREAAA